MTGAENGFFFILCSGAPWKQQQGALSEVFKGSSEYLCEFSKHQVSVLLILHGELAFPSFWIKVQEHFPFLISFSEEDL